MAEEKFDNVNRPKHYAAGKFECIDVMLAIFGVKMVSAFCILNAFKYIFRHKLKNGIEDIRKSIWYLNKYVELQNDAPPMEWGDSLD